MKPSALLSRTASLVAGIVGTLLLLEVVLRVLPVLSGTYAADPRPSWPIHTMIPNTRYTYSTAWNLQNIHRGRINNYGYASPDDYAPGRGGIAVFGDSYVESLMNEYADTLQGSLNHYLSKPHKIMSFGMSGAEMPDYLGTAALVRDRFAPEWVVIVITLGDFTHGFSATPGYFEWAPDRSPPIRLKPEIHRSTLSKWMRTIAVIRYLRGNLSMRPGELIRLRRGSDAAAGTGKCQPEVLSKEDEALLEGFTKSLASAAGVPPGHVILIFDSDRKAIYAGQSAAERQGCPQRATLANHRLKALAAQSGLQVIDSEPVFRRHFSAGLGPVDRSPIDAHWNPAAHRLMAQEVARIIDPAQF
jgi:hypothetical protein